MNDSLESRERHAHVGWMHGDAGLAPADDRIHAVKSVDRAAAGTRLALIAGGVRVVEIEAAGPLQEIAAGRGHVAELRRRAGKNRARQHRIALRDAFVISEVAVGDQRADAQPPCFGILNLRQRETSNVDQPRGARHILLHQIDEIGATGYEFSRRVPGDLLYGVADDRAP